MKRSLVFVLVTFAATCACVIPVLTVSTGNASAQTVTTAPCTPTTTKIGGGKATTYCGPATATLKVNGKTYKYKGGYCQAIPGFENDITLGTYVTGLRGLKAMSNVGKPYFKLDLGPGESSDLAIPYSGGNLVAAEGPVSWHGKATSKGTFKSLSAVPSRFSGTFDCHGVFVSG